MKRKIEVFVAGCAVCRDVVDRIRKAVCDSCEVEVVQMSDERVAQRAQSLGIRSIPAVVIDGDLASCCAGRGVDEEVLRAAGVGRPR